MAGLPVHIGAVLALALRMELAAQPRIITTEMTGAGVLLGTDVAVDGEGSTYLTGYTDAPALMIPGTAIRTECPGGANAFVS